MDWVHELPGNMWRTLKKKSLPIAGTAFVAMGVIPIILVFIWAIIEVLWLKKLPIAEILTIVKAAFPWYVSLIMDPLGFIGVYLLFFVLMWFLITVGLWEESK